MITSLSRYSNRKHCRYYNRSYSSYYYYNYMYSSMFIFGGCCSRPHDCQATAQMEGYQEENTELSLIFSNNVCNLINATNRDTIINSYEILKSKHVVITLERMSSRKSTMIFFMVSLFSGSLATHNTIN